VYGRRPRSDRDRTAGPPREAAEQDSARRAPENVWARSPPFRLRNPTPITPICSAALQCRRQRFGPRQSAVDRCLCAARIARGSRRVRTIFSEHRVGADEGRASTAYVRLGRSGPSNRPRPLDSCIRGTSIGTSPLPKRRATPGGPNRASARTPVLRSEAGSSQNSRGSPTIRIASPHHIHPSGALLGDRVRIACAHTLANRISDRKRRDRYAKWPNACARPI
jgi:hypothetical protein